MYGRVSWLHVLWVAVGCVYSRTLAPPSLQPLTIETKSEHGNLD